MKAAASQEILEELEKGAPSQRARKSRAKAIRVRGKSP
jgi:hypothetical protein